MSARPVSMTDVARHAGVSQKTVSRVVNNEPHVTEDVRSRVTSAIAELGFRPNAAARALVTKRTHRIGMITVGTALHGPASIITGVEDATRANGYSLSVVRTDGREPLEMQGAIDTLVAQGVEAIIISEPVDVGIDRVEIPADTAVLTFGSLGFTDHESEITCGVDEAQGARDATEHLLALGHDTVHHLAGPGTWISSRRRIDGWRDALADADAAEPALVVGDWTPQSGFDAMTAILHRPGLTAVFVANDQMAIGAMAAIQAAGLRVPEDISVVGFDDIPITPFLSTPLTTIKQDLAEITRLGMHRLVRSLEGHPPADRHRLVPAHLVVRATTAAPNPERLGAASVDSAGSGSTSLDPERMGLRAVD